MTGTVQELLPIEDVRRGCLVLRGGKVRALLEARPVNFTLRPPQEQEAMVAGFRAFLHSLTFPIQVVVRSVPAAVDDYLAQVRSAAAALPSAELHRLAVEHEAFVRQLSQERTILERRIYVVVGAGAAMPEAAGAALSALLPFGRRGEQEGATEQSLEAAIRVLETRVDQVLTGLVSLGVPCRRLSGEEALRVLHDFLGSGAPFAQDIDRELLPVHVATRREGSIPRREVRAGVLRSA
jgi:hypothetical protein